ncbi:SDR family oxidoreductase [Corynebacterium alimapuense]|uniref:Short chain dehydrogenase n=1 Tax=Corynebacterium alimapuense TaxID=1576874 RepID=A0A3M8K666_9CORY|nr:SDR family oxidoreductase [Corynebacterium alimapuense]RNE48713.1 short chain dehydrogenase [Corynebacterium alimapuense]
MKTALVTGASRGIGAAIARDLSRDHHVIVGATSQAGAEAIVDTLADASCFVVDLNDPAALAAATKDIEQLDVLVHSAGVAPLARVENATRQQWLDAFELNVFAVAELTQLLLPALRAAKGTVVSINSGSGYHSGAGSAIYSGTKFALRALTDALREEELGRIRVSSIHPGRVDTDMQRQLQSSMGNSDYDGSLYLRPESVAAAVRLAVDASDDASVQELSIRPSGLERN